jgi:ssDNA thymidine ADP-ribosyltransferase, DarT
MTVPSPVWIHRIVHEQNLLGVLQQGMLSRRAAKTDTNYVFIGDRELTQHRDTCPIPLPDCGSLGDYVPFYFGPLSPMLLSIKTGFRAEQRPQEEIIYLCCKVESIVKAGIPFVFSDGHAVDKLTGFYRSLDDLDQVDWPIVKERYWKNNDENPDQQRRKQAEFLVHNQVKPELISAIVVLNQEKANFVSEILSQTGHSIPVYINPHGNFYY